jgi:hypothetical protein
MIAFIGVPLASPVMTDEEFHIVIPHAFYQRLRIEICYTRIIARLHTREDLLMHIPYHAHPD